MDKKLLFLYSLAHFWMDLSCALLVFRAFSGSGEAAMCLLLYNFCAFALQMPLGLLADRFGRNGVVAAAGCCLTAAAYAVPVPVLSAASAGVGNALFHLGGGIDVLNKSGERAWALGIFVSPGALGLFVGTLWGRGARVPLWMGPLGLLALGAAVLWTCRRLFGPELRSGNAPVDVAGANRRWLLIPLFLVVVLRSYMGLNQAFAWKTAWAALLTLALALGKTAGGFAMDRFGVKRASAGSLGLAAVLYLLSALPLPGILAVFLFNMTMPVTLWAAARVMPGAKGFAFGLLTFALFLGFLPSFMGWPGLLAGPAAYSLLAAASLLLLWRPLGLV